MKKIKNVLLVALFFVSALVIAQTTVSGTVVDENGEPLPGASVVEKGTSNGSATDFDGNFTLNVKTPSTLVVSFISYGSKNISVTEGGDLGKIKLFPDNVLDEIIIIGNGVIDLAEDRETPVPVSTIKAAEIQERAVGNVEVTEIVKNTPSAYVAQQTGFGDSQLFLRGFDQTNIAVLLNGQPVNGMEDGRVYWSNWAGIADVANAVQVQRGLGSSKLAISSVGGTINLVMKSADKKQGGFVRFLGGNDGYLKGTASYDTGINEKGWSFSVLLDYWRADRKWASGTFGQGQTYFISAGYKPNDTHSFGVLLTGAPQMHGQRWSQRESTIADDPRFNQHWGFTEDLNADTGNYSSAIESERTNYYHKPVFNFNWDWTISDKSTLSTVAYASWGRGGGTGPRGDGRLRTDEGQVDYYGIEQQNLADPDGIGNSGDYITNVEDDEEGNYIRRASVNNHQWYGLVSNFETTLNDYTNLSFGADLRFYKGDHFRQVVDFYGLNGWANDRADDIVVTDAFSFNPWSALFDFADEDQRIAYDYSENINYQGVFSQIEYAKNDFSAFFQGAVSNQFYQRTGRMFAEGKSDKINKIGYNLKGGLSYDIIDDRLKIFGNAGYYSRQPFLDNIFTNIRYSNELVEPEVDNENITGIELGWRYDDRKFFAGFDAYYTLWSNRVKLDSGEINGEDVNIFRRGLEQRHVGIELDLRYKVLDNLTLKGFLSRGNWIFNKVESVDSYNDDTGELVSSVSNVDIKGVHVTDAPQTSLGFGADYKPVKGLNVYANWNYFDRHYKNEIDFDDADIQTEDVGTFQDFFLVDAGASYEFNVGDNKLIFTGNVYNLFNRITLNGSDVFGFYNTNGTTFNGSLKYQF